MPVFHHPGYIQILNRYMRWLGFRNLRYRLIDIICTNIFQTLMKLLYFKLLFTYICFLSGLSFL